MTKFKIIVSTMIILGIITGCGEKPDSKVTKKILDNGLTVLVKEDHKSSVVSIVTWVKAGYFNEPDSLTGVSHLLEHMYFKGTQRRGTGELARETKTAGGYMNGGTSYEYTTYYTVLPSKSLEKGFDIQSDALLNCAIDPDELVKETKVVIQEVKRKLDNPDAYSYEKLLELGFDKHRIRRWRMGYEDQLVSWNRDHLYNFYKTRYRPENIILSVVGDIETSQAMSLIEKYYSDFPESELETEYSPMEEPQKAFKYRRMNADINRNMVLVGFHVPGALDDDYYPLTVLDFIFSNGRASRLYQEVKEKQELAQAVGSYNDAYKDFGYFVVNAEQDEGDPLELLKSLFEQVERFKIEQVSNDELTRALNQLESSHLHSLEDVNGQARSYAYYESYGDYRLADTYLDKLRDVTAGDIQRVARKYFVLANASILEYLPFGEKADEITTDDLSSILESNLAEYNKNYVQEIREPIPIRDITAVGGKNLTDKPVLKKVLKNGITLICRENHALPIVSVAAYFNGGMFFEDDNTSGLTQLMVRTSLKGTSEMTGAEIAEAIEGMGSNISYDVNIDYFGFSFESMSKNFNEGFKLFTKIITEPSFLSEELEKEKTNLVAAIKRQKDSMRSYPVELCQQALFENHPYGMPSLGNIKTIEDIEPADLIEMHGKYVTTGNLVIAFVGDITLEEAEKLTLEYLQKIKMASKTTLPSQEIKLKSIHSKIKKRDKAQSAQALSFLTVNYASPDYEPIKVFQNVVSGMGGRLWTEVRDKRSLAYSIYGYQSSGTLAGSFICYMATSPDNSIEARRITLEVLNGFNQTPLSEEELLRAKNYTAGGFSIYMQPNSVKADVYARWEVMGKGYLDVDKYPDLISQVTAEQVSAVAEKYFTTDYYGVGMIEGKGASVKERQ